MPVISSKGLQMPESPIRKLVPYAEDAKKRGVEVFHLNIGQPDIKTPEAALQAVKENDIKILSYARSEGSEEYRKKLSQYYGKNDIEVDHDDIIVTTGGSEALLFTLGSVTDFGDEIIIPEPFYAWRRNMRGSSHSVVSTKRIQSTAPRGALPQKLASN